MEDLLPIDDDKDSEDISPAIGFYGLNNLRELYAIKQELIRIGVFTSVSLIGIILNYITTWRIEPYKMEEENIITLLETRISKRSQIHCEWCHTMYRNHLIYLLINSSKEYVYMCYKCLGLRINERKNRIRDTDENSYFKSLFLKNYKAYNVRYLCSRGILTKKYHITKTDLGRVKSYYGEKICYSLRLEGGL